LMESMIEKSMPEMSQGYSKTVGGGAMLSPSAKTGAGAGPNKAQTLGGEVEKEKEKGFWGSSKNSTRVTREPKVVPPQSNAARRRDSLEPSWSPSGSGSPGKKGTTTKRVLLTVGGKGGAMKTQQQEVSKKQQQKKKKHPLQPQPEPVGGENDLGIGFIGKWGVTSSKSSGTPSQTRGDTASRERSSSRGSNLVGWGDGSVSGPNTRTGTAVAEGFEEGSGLMGSKLTTSLAFAESYAVNL
jgi:hypothetical protein